MNISSGTVNISGGTISGNNAGLWVYGGESITLSGGTYSGKRAILVDGNASVTLEELLAARYAYHQNDIPVANAEGLGGEVPLDAKPAWLAGTVTVKECNHTGGLVPSENGYQHGGPCKCCGSPLDTANHTLGADNQCSGCGAELVAEVEKSGSDTVYVEASGLNAAFTNEGATITLLDNITTSTLIEVNTDNLTLDLNGKTYTHINNTPFRVSYDSLTIKGSGEVTTSGFYCLAVTDGTLNIENGSFSGKDSAVYVSSGTLQLTGGSFTGEKSAIAYASGEVTEALANYGGADAPHYAFYQGSSPYMPSGRSLPSGTFIVQECQHKGVTPTSNNDGTHALKCPYCGYSEATANCTYVFSGTTTGTCAVCGDSVTVAVAADNLIYDGTEKKPGVTVMRAGTELTANTDYTVAYTDNTNAGTAKVTVTIGNSQGTYTGNFNIAKASLTITASAQTITYGGSITQGTGQVTSEGLCGGDTLESVTLTPSSDQVAVADKTITPSAAVIKRGGEDAAANYNITYQPGALTINKAQAAVTGNPTANTLTYTGAAQALVTAGTTSVGDVVYSLTETGTYSTTIPTGTDAGSYTVWYKVEGTTNYEGTALASVDVTIAQATAPAPQTGTLNVQNGQNRDYTYNLSRLLPVLASGQSFGGEVTYTLKTVNITKAGYYESGTAVISGTNAKLQELVSGAEKVRQDYAELINWAKLFDNCNFEAKEMIIAQFVKAVRVKRDYEIEVEFNVAFDEFQQIYLEPEKAEDKARGTTTILALAEKVGQAV